MKLHQYFTYRSQEHLSDQKKVELYQRIIEQRAQSHATKRWSLLRKKLSYAFLAGLLVFAVFGTYFWDSLNTTNYRAFWTQKLPSVSVVQADQVGQILTINGDYIIEKEGKQFQNSVLFDGDLITLKNNAKIIFNINQDAKIQITGPAQFVIAKKVNGNYLLNLISGDFLKIESQKSQEVLEVETSKLSFEMGKDQHIDIELTAKAKHVQLTNNGSPLLVKTKWVDNPESETQTQLSKDKVLTLQDNDISKIEDIETFRHALIAGNNITHTSQPISTIAPSADKEQILEEIWILLTSTVSSPVGEVEAQAVAQVNQQLGYQQDEKKIPTEAQLSQLTAALNTQFLLADLQSIYDAKLNGTSADETLNLLALKIATLGQTYGVKLSVGANFASLKQGIIDLQKGLEAYHLPPQKIQQLKKLNAWLISLETLSPTLEWDKYFSNLPETLRF